MQLLKKYILFSTLSLFMITYAFCEGVPTRNIEKVLEDKTRISSDCSVEPCANDIDQLLDILNTEATGERQGSTIETQFKASEIILEPFKTMKKAKIVVLNKITAKSEQIIFEIGKIKFFGNLSIEVHKCVQSTNPYESNNLILLTIFDNKADDDQSSIFHGWVTTSNPSLSTLEHPVYEVIPLTCLPSDVKNPKQN